jgi:myo-inositol-1(or 4)-monophosphatase
MQETTVVDSAVPELLKQAEEAARTAGTYLLQKLGSARVTAHKSARDDLLDADLEAERLLLTRLRQVAPSLGMLSEESGREGSENRYWIVDPLDGSTNFQHGSPLFAIAIALVAQQVTLGGLIYVPAANELFTAIQGQGAYLNGTRIHVSQTATLEAAIVHVGDLTKEDNPQTLQEGLKEISQLTRQARRIRMLGSAAIDLAYTACGRADVLINHAQSPWDIEAGKLLLLEAGGTVTTKPSQNHSHLHIYSNRVIHQAVEELLSSQAEIA